jgi:hypothetical protein
MEATVASAPRGHSAAMEATVILKATAQAAMFFMSVSYVAAAPTKRRHFSYSAASKMPASAALRSALNLASVYLQNGFARRRSAVFALSIATS